MTTQDIAARVRIRLVGGPTAILDLGGLRLMTDPTFDPPGDYPVGERVLTKTTGPTITPAEAGRVDAVLLSHDQHADNLDHAGRALLRTVPLVLSTASAADRIGAPVTALPSWQHVDIARPDGGGRLRVTAVPAQHGPDGTEHLTGEVTGFVLTGTRLPTVYVSGDNASLDVVREIAARFAPIDLAVLFGGAARTPLLGEANLTLDAEAMVAATRILDARAVVPVHVEGWGHFTEGTAAVREAFERAGLTGRLDRAAYQRA